MPIPVWCSGCDKLLSSPHHFQQHLQGSRYCAEVFVDRQPPGPNGLSRPNPRKREQRNLGITLSEYLADPTAILEEEKKRKEERSKFDLSEFEFKDDEDPNPVPKKQIRVLELKGRLQSDVANFPLLSIEQQKQVLAKNALIDGLLHGNVPLGKSNLGLSQSNLETGKSNLDSGRQIVDNEEFDIVNHGGEGNAPATEEANNVVEEKGPDERPKNQFREYVEEAKKQFHIFSPEMVAAIELMDLMNQKGGSVALFDAVFEWHMEHLKTEKVVSAEKLHRDLVTRYNLGPTLPIEKQVQLPFSKETVDIPCHCAKAQFVDLITDPRWTDNDWLFHNDDPLCDPPEEWTKVGDVNTGRAHRKTWEQLIQPEPYTLCGRKKVLCEFIFYIDGCNTAQFGTPLEILKFTIGWLKGTTRLEEHAWRKLGYVRRAMKRAKKAAENLTKSGHVDATMFVKDPSHRGKQFAQAKSQGPLFDADVYANKGAAQNNNNNNNNNNNRGRKGKRKRNGRQIPQIKPQDFHAVLQTIMESYKTIEEEGGIPVDLHYRGKTYNLLAIPYILMVKADSKEANKVCGTYDCSLEGVKCLCRMCCIPNEQTDQPYIEPKPAMKTQEMILSLVRRNDDEAKQELKNISQHDLWNCFYNFQFGLHNNAGIHGAAPMEVLHWVQLLTYKYNRDSFFQQTGESSQLSDNIDALTQTFGLCLERQSDRNLPRTKFSEGIRGGYMQAHEMTGAMLLLVLSLRCRSGRNLLLETARGAQKEFFSDDEDIKKWIRMLETHLMFEKWLGKEEHEVRLLQRAEVKVKELMSMTKHVGQRSKGRGYKMESFHTTMHMPQLAMDLCAPIHWSTASNESHHKTDKKTALRTSRQFETFDISVAIKDVYRHGVDLAMEEIHNDVRRWDYFRRLPFEPLPEPEPFETDCSGPFVDFLYQPGTGQVKARVHSKMVGKDKYQYDGNTLGYITGLARDLFNDHNIRKLTTFGTLKLYSKTAKNNSQIFYAKPYYSGKPWNDWAIFDLRDADSPTPNARNFVAAQIKCFLDLSELPKDNATMKPPGIYAIIEPTKPNQDFNERWWSELFEAIVKEPCAVPGFENKHNNQEMVSIDRIRLPTVVVPDIGNPNKRAYLRMIPRDTWAGLFDDWLEEDHVKEFE